MLTSTQTSEKQTISIKEATAEQLASGLIISIGEARKIMGAEASELGDNQLAHLILELSELAHELLKVKSNDR
jgi:hypothetical protein